jgi:hypothetical protein
MPHVGVRYTSIETVETNASYRCASCGFTSPVRVIGVGNASASASHLLGNYASARDAAQRGARREASADIPRMMGLVPCPSCAKRDPTGVRRFFVAQGVKLGLVLFLVSLGTLFVFHRLGATGILVAWSVAVGLAILIYFFAVGPQDEWARASLCVQFPKPEPTPEEIERLKTTLREILLELLSSREVHCPLDAQRRIASCDDLATLRRWTARAASAGTFDEVVEG